MLIYSLQKLFSSLITLFVAATLIFFLLRVAPGGPFDDERAVPAEVQANILKRYDLDRPVLAQYWSWLKSAAQGDFRESFQNLDVPVSEIIGGALPASFQLGGLALAISLALGIPLGCIAAWKQNTWLDTSAMFLAVAGVSLPNYLVASLLVVVFSFWFSWLPPALWEGPESMILPVVTLALRPLAMVARLIRASMLEAFSTDYIRTAHAKGLQPLWVVFKHALRNSLIPVTSLIGVIAANLVTGSFVIETFFQIPGLGRHFVQSIINRDYPLAMGAALTYGLVLVVCTLLTDLLLAWADPRLRLQNG
jgi:oligopeptide transport system permease protein